MDDYKYNLYYYNNFYKELEREKDENILRSVFPKIIELALDLPNKLLKPIPILKSGLKSSHIFAFILPE